MTYDTWIGRKDARMTDGVDVEIILDFTFFMIRKIIIFIIFLKALSDSAFCCQDGAIIENVRPRFGASNFILVRFIAVGKNEKKDKDRATRRDVFQNDGIIIIVI